MYGVYKIFWGVKKFFEFRRRTCFLDVSWDFKTFWFFVWGLYKYFFGLSGQKNFFEFRRQTCFLDVSWDSKTFWFFLYKGYPLIYISEKSLKIVLSKIKISFVQNIELVELITINPIFNYIAFTVFEIFTV